jgi:hypothetical protein
VPKRAFPLAAGEKARLEVSWKLFWKDIEVRLDGKLVGAIPDKRALEEGREFGLDDGTRVRVQLETGFGRVELRVLRDGKPLPGSDSDPETRLKVAAGLIWFVAAMSGGLGVLALALRIEVLLRIGVGIGSIVEGAIFAVLAFFAGRRSTVALALAIALFAFDGVATFFLAAQQTPAQPPPVGAIVVRVFLLLGMSRGFEAITELSKGTPPATEAARG